MTLTTVPTDFQHIEECAPCTTSTIQKSPTHRGVSQQSSCLDFYNGCEVRSLISGWVLRRSIAGC